MGQDSRGALNIAVAWARPSTGYCECRRIAAKLVDVKVELGVSNILGKRDHDRTRSAGGADGPRATDELGDACAGFDPDDLFRGWA
jgi:hypothetical protein